MDTNHIKLTISRYGCGVVLVDHALENPGLLSSTVWHLNPPFLVALLPHLCGGALQGFTSVDEQLLNECQQQNWQDGATAVAVWVVGQDTALVANVGDAKCVLARTAEKVRQHTCTRRHP